MICSDGLNLRSGCPIPLVDRARDEGWIIAHRKVVSFANDQLRCIGKSPPPLLLRMEWVVALAEDREHRETGELFVQCSGRFDVERVAPQRVGEVVVKRANVVRSESR